LKTKSKKFSYLAEEIFNKNLSLKNEVEDIVYLATTEKASHCRINEEPAEFSRFLEIDTIMRKVIRGISPSRHILFHTT
jgi:hypothetical protein